MRTLLSNKLVHALLAIAIIFPACQSGQKKSQQNTSSSTTSPELKKEEIEKDVREFVYPLPTSFEVTEMLNRIGAGYILTLSNSPENVDKYLTEKKRALNLGIYGTDLSYASTYNQKQETINFMEASKKLVDALNISAALPSDIVEQVDQNQNNKDELVKIITNTFYDTYSYLNSNERSSVSMLILTGSWVEALYITTHISEDTYQNKEMVKIVMEQKSSLSKLTSLMQTIQDDPQIQSIMSQLQPLQKVYNQVESNAISEAQMNTIITEVKNIRDEFVK